MANAKKNLRWIFGLHLLFFLGSVAGLVVQKIAFEDQPFIIYPPVFMAVGVVLSFGLSCLGVMGQYTAYIFASATNFFVILGFGVLNPLMTVYPDDGLYHTEAWKGIVAISSVGTLAALLGFYNAYVIRHAASLRRKRK